MKSLILLMLIGDVTSGQHTTKRDITSEIDVYASLRPVSMMACMVQCAQSPICSSVLLEEKTKTCFLNRNVTKGSFVGIRGYQYSKKADITKPERVQQCSANAKKEFEACSKNRNGVTHATTDTTKTTITTPGRTPVTTTPGTTTTMITSGTTTPTTTTSKMPTSDMTSSIIDTTAEDSVTNTSQQPCPRKYLTIPFFDPPTCCRIEITNPANFSVAEAICQTGGSAFILPNSLERLDAVKEAIFTSKKHIVSGNVIVHAKLYDPVVTLVQDCHGLM